VGLLDFINFLLAILFYILAKLEFYLVIFREALGVALIIALQLLGSSKQKGPNFTTDSTTTNGGMDSCVPSF
jgi:hypothetical protein